MTKFCHAMKIETGIVVDPSRVGVMGRSSGRNMAAILGGEPVYTPKAILCFYGMLYTERDHYHSPLADLAILPFPDPAFVNKVFEGPVSIEAPSVIKLGRPDMSQPRSAWYLDKRKRGTYMAECVKDGDCMAVNGAYYICERYPPTFLLHGTKDAGVPCEYTRDFAKDLERLGVQHELILVPDKKHMFDCAINKMNDPVLLYIQRAFDFLQRHV